MKFSHCEKEFFEVGKSEMITFFNARLKVDPPLTGNVVNDFPFLQAFAVVVHRIDNAVVHVLLSEMESV